MSEGFYKLLYISESQLKATKAEKSNWAKHCFKLKNTVDQTWEGRNWKAKSKSPLSGIYSCFYLLLTWYYFSIHVIPWELYIVSIYCLFKKLHAEGKTEEARADLARLAIIRKQREEAAKKREEEQKGM